MYFYPFLLISSDIERNRNLSTMFHNKIQEYLEKKRLFYDSLDLSELEKAILLSLLFLEHQNGLILTECFRANVTAIYGTMQELDGRRMYEKGKRLLLLLRKKSYETLNIFDDTFFTNL